MRAKNNEKSFIKHFKTDYSYGTNVWFKNDGNNYICLLSLN